MTLNLFRVLQTAYTARQVTHSCDADGARAHTRPPCSASFASACSTSCQRCSSTPRRTAATPTTMKPGPRQQRCHVSRPGSTPAAHLVLAEVCRCHATQLLELVAFKMSPHRLDVSDQVAAGDGAVHLHTQAPRTSQPGEPRVLPPTTHALLCNEDSAHLAVLVEREKRVLRQQRLHRAEKQVQRGCRYRSSRFLLSAAISG